MCLNWIVFLWFFSVTDRTGQFKGIITRRHLIVPPAQVVPIQQDPVETQNQVRIMRFTPENTASSSGEESKEYIDPMPRPSERQARLHPDLKPKHS